jgi:hypothetical protein
MKKYIVLLLTFHFVKEMYCQDNLINDLYLNVQSFQKINGSFIIRATDVEKKYADTITLISFKDSIYIKGQLKNQIQPGYGNLQKLTKGKNYYFKLFKPIIHVYSMCDRTTKSEYSNFFIVSGKDTIWNGSDIKNIPYGIANGLADTIQYLNPILNIVDSVPKPIIINKENIKKLKFNTPKSLREKADLCICIDGIKNSGPH